MAEEQYAEIDRIFEDNIKHILPYKLPYDYSNNIVIVVDGTGSKSQFEEDSYIKGGEYKMKTKARWPNGNWASHSSNFYEDYRGAKYYWYGPDEAAPISAGSEVHGLVEGVVDIVCEFIGNATLNGKHKLDDINIDAIGYSRGGYVVMEAARKLDRDGCSHINTQKIKFRFMGLYDPVSTMVYCDGINIFKDCHGSVIAGDDKGLYWDDSYKYNADVMPTNVDHIVISYGDPDVGSRAIFNTAEDQKDNDKREEIEYNKFKTTHGGVGGIPLDGDYDGFAGVIRKIVGDVDLTKDMECTQSMNVDLFIRSKANQYGLPIDATDKDYYNFYQCDGHYNE